jgi:hypothetical protein
VLELISSCRFFTVDGMLELISIANTWFKLAKEKVATKDNVKSKILNFIFNLFSPKKRLGTFAFA